MYNLTGGGLSGCIIITFFCFLKMVNKLKCVVKTCENVFKKHKHCSFHQLPSNIQMQEQWVSVLKENDPSLGLPMNCDTTRVCGHHFSRDSFVLGTTRLHKTAIPNVFSNRKPGMNNF